MRLLMCILLALAIPPTQSGCATVMDAMIAALLDSDDDCDEPSIQPNDRQIRSDQRRLVRGDTMRYHRDERELQRHQRDVQALKQRQRWNH